MTTNIFISYSRREMGFVDDLVSNIEKQNYTVWLDYRVLIPGSPWKGQIEKGLNESDTVLLVVSKESLASPYVEVEWKHFTQNNKRVILAIFEAVKLPPELQTCEWVDFRFSYQPALQKLFSMLKQPLQKQTRVPQSGFMAPPIIWLAFLISLLCAFLSLFTWWTIFIPCILMPLPIRILKRNFNIKQTQAALAMLPLGLFMQAMTITDVGGVSIFLTALTCWAIFVAPTLFFILRSTGMQRWGKPEANVPKFANPYQTNDVKPTSVSVYVDYALQDRIVAEDLFAAIKKLGHQPAENINNASAVFALLSRFKSSTDADPEKQTVFPVILQTNKNIDPKLSMIQWIDFRPGVRKLDVIAKLLPTSAVLLKALGSRPVSSQTVYPPIITTMYYFLIFLGTFTIGSTIKYLETSFSTLLNLPFFSLVAVLTSFGLNTLIVSGFLFFMLQSITSRIGWFASIGRTTFGFFFMFFLLYWQFTTSARADGKLASIGIESVTGIAAGLPLVIYFFGMLMMTLVFLWNQRDIRRWFPAKVK